MHRVIAQKVISWLKGRAGLGPWPHAFGTAGSVASALTLASGVSPAAFRLMLEGRFGASPNGLGDAPGISSGLRALLLAKTGSTPLSPASMHAVREALRREVTDREAGDIVLLLGFGDPVFPVCGFLRRILACYHLFDDADSYADVQAAVAPAAAGAAETAGLFLAVKLFDLLSEDEKEAVVKEALKAVPLACSNCGQGLDGCGNPYVADLKLYQSRNTFFTAEDMMKDLRKEWEQALKDAEQTDPGEMESQVYAHYRLILCGSCRKRLGHRIENGELV